MSAVLLTTTRALQVAPTTTTTTSLLRRDLRLGNVTIKVQGVLHGSASSIRDVQTALEEEPDVIVLELCVPRWRSMTEKKKTSFIEDVKQSFAKKSFARKTNPLNVGLAGMYRLSSLVGFDPGREFLVPLDYAKKNKVHVILGDRDVRETLSELSAVSSFDFQGLRALLRGVVGPPISIPWAVIRDPLRQFELLRLSGAVALFATPVIAAVDTVDSSRNMATTTSKVTRRKDRWPRLSPRPLS